jgi:hypothetical protein
MLPTLDRTQNNNGRDARAFALTSEKNANVQPQRDDWLRHDQPTRSVPKKDVVPAFCRGWGIEDAIWGDDA